MRNVALDLGVRKIAYCEVEHGLVIRRTTVGSLSALESWLGPEQPPARVAVEACLEAWAVHAKLTQWGNEVLLVDTTRTKQIGIGQHQRKTDRIDAEVLAHALAEGRLPLAHLLSKSRQEMRRELGVRRALVETRAQYVTSIRGLCRQEGQMLKSCDVENFVANVRKTQLSEPLMVAITPLLVILENINQQVVTLDERLEQLAEKEPVIQLLRTVPGVGPITAISFVSVIDDAKRFQRAHQVESYIGLVPGEHSSGGKRRIGSITKQGNSYLRAMLVQASWSVLRFSAPDDPLRSWAEALSQRRGKRIAVVALARRLAGVLWAMWRDNTVYDPVFAARSGARGLRAAEQTLKQRAAALEQAVKKQRARHVYNKK